MNAIAWMVEQAPKLKARPSRYGERRGGTPGRRRTMPQEIYDRAASMLESGSMTMAEIARELKVSRGVVVKLRNRLKDGLGAPVAASPITAKQVDELASLVAAGFTVREAAREMGIRQTTAEGIIRHKVGMGARQLRTDPSYRHSTS